MQKQLFDYYYCINFQLGTDGFLRVKVFKIGNTGFSYINI